MSVINRVFKRLLNSKLIHEVEMDLLAEDEYIPDKLEEICRRCPAKNGLKYCPLDAEQQREIDDCRKRFFGVLLESFVGRPGDGETSRLYLYLKHCEYCLMKGHGQIGNMPFAEGS